MNPFPALSDDFGLFVNLATRMELPSNRETVLHFFNSLQKSFPRMTEFDRRETGEFFLEESRESGSFRWVSLENRRMSSGYVNPPDLDEVDSQLDRVLEVAPFHLDLCGLDTELLEVVYAFDFDFSGNHDEVVAEALASHSPLEGLTRIPGSRVLHYEPSMTLVLDDTCRLQAIMAVQTRTNAFQVREHQFPDLPISVYFTVRQYWLGQPFETFAEGYRHLRRVGHDLLESHVVPGVIRPLAQSIEAHG